MSVHVDGCFFLNFSTVTVVRGRDAAPPVFLPFIVFLYIDIHAVTAPNIWHIYILNVSCYYIFGVCLKNENSTTCFISLCLKNSTKIKFSGDVKINISKECFYPFAAVVLNPRSLFFLNISDTAAHTVLVWASGLGYFQLRDFFPSRLLSTVRRGLVLSFGVREEIKITLHDQLGRKSLASDFYGSLCVILRFQISSRHRALPGTGLQGQNHSHFLFFFHCWE